MLGAVDDADKREAAAGRVAPAAVPAACFADGRAAFLDAVASSASLSS